MKGFLGDGQLRFLEFRQICESENLRARGPQTLGRRLVVTTGQRSAVTVGGSISLPGLLPFFGEWF